MKMAGDLDPGFGLPFRGTAGSAKTLPAGFARRRALRGALADF